MCVLHIVFATFSPKIVHLFSEENNRTVQVLKVVSMVKKEPRFSARFWTGMKDGLKDGYILSMDI